jgi:hypothetical protein
VLRYLLYTLVLLCLILPACVTGPLDRQTEALTLSPEALARREAASRRLDGACQDSCRMK